MPTIGIDLGTTNSCVAVLRNGKVDVLENDLGSRITPSWVAYTDEERLIGEAAVYQSSSNHENTVYDAKRLIGRRFDDPVVQSDKKNWPFQVIQKDGKINIQVRYQETDYTFCPEEISAAVLEKMKSIAEDRLGEKVYDAVITVPAYFNDGQRRATKAAARIAGLHVKSIINEPTAAAIAYGLQRGRTTDKRKVLIFDLGGGTFDVTVLEIEDGCFNVKATGGDTHLGGQDFNERLFNHLLGEFSRKTKKDMTKNGKSKQKLRKECEVAKKNLSSAQRTRVQIDGLCDGEDFNVQVTRARFEKLNEDLFRGTLEVVKEVLDEAGMTMTTLDDVVLVGGSTRIPYISEMLEEYFGKDKIRRVINPDEAVANGAAVHAAMLSGDMSAEIRGLKLFDVTPLTLGVEIKTGVMYPIIKRNTTIPAEAKDTLVTMYDEQTSMRYNVFEGEWSTTKMNHLLGSFLLSDLPSLPAGDAKTEVCFKIDADGVLHVSAKDLSRTGNQNSIKIEWDKGGLGDEEINHMIINANQFRADDEKRKRALIALSDLEILAKKAKNIARDKKGASNKNRVTLTNLLESVLNWIEENPGATTSEIKLKTEELDEAVRSFK